MNLSIISYQENYSQNMNKQARTTSILLVENKNQARTTSILLVENKNQARTTSILLGENEKKQV